MPAVFADNNFLESYMGRITELYGPYNYAIWAI